MVTPKVEFVADIFSKKLCFAYFGTEKYSIDLSYYNFCLFFFFCFICHFYPPFTRKRIVLLYFGREVRTRLGVAFFEVYGPPVFHIKAGASR